MDIHAPERPVHSFKDFATHIAIVTIGILIALGLDGLREHFRERKLVRETRDAMRYEMRENDEHAKLELERVTAYDKLLTDTVAEMPELAEKHPDELKARIMKVQNPGYFFAASSWQSALSTGALAHMSTEEVAAYANASEAIRLYTGLQRDLVTQEDSMAAFLLSHPHPAASDLSSMTEHLILLSRAERSAAYVGPEMKTTVEQALQAAGN